ncbi:hypothetical protein BOTBODRAFT_26686 [Botryobasidium botryosum FD-172 SS1]|uniref:J domain-containing protein n=1 Tax=Botryobasidium botryosum (strain FD-172 SS1) TaxID=930990 RepID=A0A067N964_BOTB1|nr:hypothetical protein BOTBODRAFT_26686 [Botryobasidium botryosum FD-172 SS1]
MLRHLAFLFALIFLVSTALAWTKEDYEIFDLVGAIEAAEGPGTTFYSWLGVAPTATTQEISKAYRRKSVALHPDKNPGVKNIQKRFARLGVVAQILRDHEGRKRYDFFYKNGVPKWRGTGYYYSRFRPGLGAVLLFLALLTSTLQHVISRMNHKRDLARIDDIARQAKLQAWGPRMVPLEGQRKVRVGLGGHPGQDEGGRGIDVLVSPEACYLLEDDELVPLDSTLAPSPSFANTWFIALIRSLVSRVLPKSSSPTTEAVSASEAETTEVEETDATASDSAPIKINGAAAAVKAGGRRRKAVAPKRK